MTSTQPFKIPATEISAPSVTSVAAVSPKWAAATAASGLALSASCDAGTDSVSVPRTSR